MHLRRYTCPPFWYHMHRIFEWMVGDHSSEWMRDLLYTCILLFWGVYSLVVIRDCDLSLNMKITQFFSSIFLFLVGKHNLIEINVCCVFFFFGLWWFTIIGRQLNTLTNRTTAVIVYPVIILPRFGRVAGDWLIENVKIDMTPTVCR